MMMSFFNSFFGLSNKSTPWSPNIHPTAILLTEHLDRIPATKEMEEIREDIQAICDDLNRLRAEEDELENNSEEEEEDEDNLDDEDTYQDFEDQLDEDDVEELESTLGELKGNNLPDQIQKQIVRLYNELPQSPKPQDVVLPSASDRFEHL